MTWEEHARTELGPKMASSIFVITINPDEIDPKVALETGYAVLLNKPIIVVARADQVVQPGLERIAHNVIRLDNELGTDAGQMEFAAKLVIARQGLSDG